MSNFIGDINMKIKAVIVIFGIFVTLIIGCSEKSTTPPDNSKLSGRWIGSTNRNSLDMTITESNISGSLDYIMYMGDAEFDYELDVNGNFNDPNVEMEFTGSSLNLSYTGTLSEDNQTINGTFIDDFEIDDIMNSDI